MAKYDSLRHGDFVVTVTDAKTDKVVFQGKPSTSLDVLIIMATTDKPTRLICNLPDLSASIEVERTTA